MLVRLAVILAVADEPDGSHRPQSGGQAGRENLHRLATGGHWLSEPGPART